MQIAKFELPWLQVIVCIRVCTIAKGKYGMMAATYAADVRMSCEAITPVIKGKAFPAGFNQKLHMI